MANILKEKNNVKLLHRNSMSEDESSELPSTKVGHMKISYSDLEKMDERICQNCYHNYKDHVDESGNSGLRNNNAQRFPFFVMGFCFFL
ncbi:MAG: hypothetical protein IS860_10570 [Nitrosopumilus sp.]|nr:hypothetical protein [Nitrosopumilus sp.]